MGDQTAPIRRAKTLILGERSSTDEREVKRGVRMSTSVQGGTLLQVNQARGSFWDFRAWSSWLASLAPNSVGTEATGGSEQAACLEMQLHPYISQIRPLSLSLALWLFGSVSLSLADLLNSVRYYEGWIIICVLDNVEIH